VHTFDLAYEGRGTAGPPLILVHGFPVDRGLWRAQLDGLGGVARVVALDLPGFGGSPAPDVETRTMDDFAAAVIALADGLGFRRFVVGGLSMGGYIALAVARACRDRLLGLLLCDTRAEPDSPAGAAARQADAARALQDGVGPYVDALLPRVVAPGSPPAARAELQRMMHAVRPAAFAAALRGMAVRPDARPELAALAVPTLCLVGAEDTLTPPETMRALADAIPGAELAIVPGGHAAPLESPEEANAAIARLLARIDH
jgi:pimeloyl-ACP methyl ester carboxylesterase